MAKVRPFRATRFDWDRLGDPARIVCAPFDIISPAEQEDCYARDPHNAIRLELARQEPTDDERENRYTRAARTLRAWRAEGVLRRDESPSMFLYEETFERNGARRPRRSVVATLQLAEWDERVVLPHERTLPKAKADRLSLLRAIGVQLSPLLMLYDDPGQRVRSATDEATAGRPLLDFEVPAGTIAEAARRHRYWRLGNEPARAVGAALADQQIVIADGHHRYETALNYRRERRERAGAADPEAPYEHVMVHLIDVADENIVVLPTHRLVRGMAGLDIATLRRSWERSYTVEPLAVPDEPGAAARAISDDLARQSVAGRVAFAVAGLAPRGVERLVLRRLPDAWHGPESWKGLDVGVLQATLIEELPGRDAGTEVSFSRDPAGTLAAVWAGEQQLAFFTNPTPLRAILDVARGGDRMPEKSTYVAPKPVTGLAMHELD